MGTGSSPISSRKRVPPWAASNRPLLVGVGAGEGALARGRTARTRCSVSGMAPQLTATKASVGAPRQLVQGARGQLLAGARLADQQHAGAGRGDLADHLEHPLHGRRLADQPVQLVAALDLVAQDDVLALQHPPLERALDHQPHLVHLERLGQVVVGAGLHGGDGGLGGGEGGHHDDLGVGVQLLGFRQHVQPAAVGHLEVGDDDVELARGHGLAGGRRRRRRPRPGARRGAGRWPGTRACERSSSTIRMSPVSGWPCAGSVALAGDQDQEAAQVAQASGRSQAARSARANSRPSGGEPVDRRGRGHDPHAAHAHQLHAAGR